MTASSRTRRIRVFLSSTFRDMNAERDYIVRFVFPAIKEYCDSRFLDFTPVDLRWGIPEEYSRNGLVLSTCLEEVDNCRPFFIGILGSRYGWMPDQNELRSLRHSLIRSIQGPDMQEAYDKQEEQFRQRLGI